MPASQTRGGRLVIVMCTLRRSGNERHREECRQKGENGEQVEQPDGYSNRTDVHSGPPFLARQILGLFYHDPLACQSVSSTGVRSKSQSGEGIEALAGTNAARTRHKPAEASTPGGKSGVGVATIASASNTQHLACPSYSCVRWLRSFSRPRLTPHDLPQCRATARSCPTTDAATTGHSLLSLPSRAKSSGHPLTKS